MGLVEKMTNMRCFLKPAKIEKCTYGLGIFLGYVGCSVTAAATKEVGYSAIGFVTPIFLQYCFYRSMEIGIFGKQVKRIFRQYWIK